MAQKLKVPCEAMARLGPNDPVAPIRDQLASSAPAVVVGHLPFLDHLASLIVTGDERAAPIAFRNAALVALDSGKIQWILWPELA